MAFFKNINIHVAGFYGSAMGNNNGPGDRASVGMMNYLCQLPSLVRENLEGAGSFSYSFTSLDRYSVLILRCLYNETSEVLSAVDVDVTVHITNPSGTELSLDTVPYLQSSLAFLVMFLIMIAVMAGQIFRAQPDAVKPLHMLFLITVSFGALSYLLWYLDMRQQDIDGKSEYGIILGLRIVDHVYTTLYLASLLLVSFGWTLSRTFLSEREFQFIAFVLSAYFVLGLLSAACLGVSDICTSLFVFSYVVRTILLLGVVVAMNFSVTQLRTIIYHSPWIQSILFLYARSKQFNYFRAAFLLYLIIPSFLLLIQVTILSWESAWIADFLVEILDVMLAVVIGIVFAPMSESYLSRAFDGSLDASVLVRHDE